MPTDFKYILVLIGISHNKAEQHLQGIELQKKKKLNIKYIGKLIRKNTNIIAGVF